MYTKKKLVNNVSYFTSAAQYGICLILFSFFLTACDSDDTPSQESLLPPITMTGENTFGCLIDGKFFRPRDGRISVNSDNKGLRIVRTESDNLELHIYDRKSEFGGSLFIHLENFYLLNEATYELSAANGLRGLDGPDHNYIYGRFWDAQTNSYQLYFSTNNTGNVDISRFEIIPNILNIKSGTFNATLTNASDPNQTVSVSLGRFDFDSFSLERVIWN